ncbi:MAG: hypothetical protein WCU00_11200 [Candidatus Latescibacterota bacterium]
MGTTGIFSQSDTVGASLTLILTPAFLFSWLIVFETKGKSLEEIEKMLVRK